MREATTDPDGYAASTGPGAPAGRSWSRRSLLGWSVGGLAGLLAACTGPGVTVTATTTGTGGSSSSRADAGGAPTTAGASSTRSTTADPSATTTGQPVPPVPVPAGTLHALLLGSDSRSERLRPSSSDVITLVQLTADRTRLNLVSVARDTLVEYPWGGRGKVNAVYARGGPDAAASAVSALLGGIPIQFVVETGFSRFIRISELLGGFTVDNRVSSASSGIPFPAGPLALRGEPSLHYVRERKGLPNGDLDRTERHRAALTGMLLKMQQLAAQPGVLERLVPALVAQTEPRGFTAGHAEALVPVARSIAKAQITSVMLPIARFGMVGGASVDIVNTARAGELAAALRAADLSGYVGRYGTSNAPTG